MVKESKTTLRGRDAKDGRFTTVERLPKSGRISKSSRAIFESTSKTYGRALRSLAKK